MARQWTDDQLKAINTTGGSLLVSAAAGSGKTAVLVERLIKKITDRKSPVDADKFLVVTFTKAAAAEMRERVAKRLRELLSESPSDTFLQHQILLLEQAQICTIDSFFAKIVRENFEILGVSPSLRVADDSLLIELKNEVLDGVLKEKFNKKEECFLSLVDYFSDKDDSSLKDSILDVYGKIRSFPFPFKWVDEQISRYKSDTPLAKTIWGQIIISHLKEGIKFCENLITRMMEFAESDEIVKKSYYPSAVMDADELAVLKSACEEENWDKIYNVLCFYSFSSLKPIRNYESECKKRFGDLRGILKDEIKKFKELVCCTEENYFSDIKAQSPIVEEFFNILKKFYLSLEKEKEELNIGDFNDFAYFTLQLVSDENGNPTEFAKDFSVQFEEILLDEYQDTNPLQDLIFKCISKNEENLFFVGDLKQSIYRFRNADPEVFKGKKKAYAPLDKDNFPASITLSRNFRSRKGVTDGINAVFSALMSENVGDVDYNDDEKLYCGADYYPEIPDCPPETALQIIDVSKEENEDKGIIIEAKETARRIAKMIKEKYPVTEDGKLRPCRGEDFTILLRSTKHGIADCFITALKEENLDAVSDSSMGYFSSREVSVMVSLLKVLDNPMLNTELTAVLLSPMFAFTCDEVASLFVYNPKSSLYFSLVAQAEQKNKKAKNFIKVFNSLRRKSAVMSVQKLIQYIYDTTDFIEVASGMTNPAVREANLKILLKYAIDFEASGKSELSDFIFYIDSLIDSGKDFDVATPAVQASQAVKVMTIHKSKGLEFPIVILANCSKEHNLMDLNKTIVMHSKAGIGFNFVNREKLRSYPTVPLKAIKLLEKACILSEEMRLLYVAMTRAKEKLILNITEKELGKKLTGKLEFLIDHNGNIEPYIAGKIITYSEWLLLSFIPLKSFSEINDIYKVVSVSKEGCKLDILALTTVAKTAEEKKVKKVSYDKETLLNLAENISFEYPYSEETVTPAKLSVTQITHKNDEKIFLSAPRFTFKDGFTAAQKGSIFHRVLQFADFENGKKNAENELSRLVKKGYLTEKEAEAVDLSKLEAFFASTLTERILNADKVYREYKFFDTIPATEAGYESGSEILIQGIADCIIEENKKGVLIDFKTDIVTEASVLEKRYKDQLMLYKRALGSLFENGIDECIIYSLHLNKEIKVKL